MSDHVTSYIPSDPTFVPSEGADQAAIEFLRRSLQASVEIWSDTSDGIVFRDSGENFERVRCPSCRATIAMDTWQDWMTDDCDDQGYFKLNTIVTSCCDLATTLNDLVYESPQGFSRYALSLRNAGGELGPQVHARLQDALGCVLKSIRQMI